MIGQRAAPVGTAGIVAKQSECFGVASLTYGVDAGEFYMAENVGGSFKKEFDVFLFDYGIGQYGSADR